MARNPIEDYFINRKSDDLRFERVLVVIGLIIILALLGSCIFGQPLPPMQ